MAFQVVIECVEPLAEALASDLRRQMPEETGLAVTADGGRVVIDNVASQEIAESLAGSLNRSLPEGVSAVVGGDE